MKKLAFVCAFLLFSSLIIAQNNKILNKTKWNGYAQVRALGNQNGNYGFMLRRLKFWLKSTPGFSEHWSYKIQALFTSWAQEKFFLQDAKVRYKNGRFSVDMGQFTPRYSLQWTQPDYKINAIERAIVVNLLHPNGSLGVRDIGLQANYQSTNNLLDINLGLFNGFGIKHYQFNDQSFMFTHRAAVNLGSKKRALKLGYSMMYRKANHLAIPHVLPDSVLFTGEDLRYNFFALFKTETFEFQTEFLNADIGGKESYGYYLLSNVNIKKHQIVASYEYYQDLIDETINAPYYRIGYNYLINKYKIKLFFDNYFQINNNEIENYMASVELQFFFN